MKNEKNAEKGRFLAVLRLNPQKTGALPPSFSIKGRFFSFVRFSDPKLYNSFYEYFYQISANNSSLYPDSPKFDIYCDK